MINFYSSLGVTFIKLGKSFYVSSAILIFIIYSNDNNKSNQIKFDPGLFNEWEVSFEGHIYTHKPT